MGADLYIHSLFEPNQARWAPQFDEAAELRDSLTADSPERQEAQERVSECYEQMYSQGYSDPARIVGLDEREEPVEPEGAEDTTGADQQSS